MDDKDLAKLQDTDNRDYDKAEIHEPVRNPRTVLSVAFNRADFLRVTECARQVGMRTSEFVREAALSVARKQQTQKQLTSYTSSDTLDVWIPRSQLTVGGMTVKARVDRPEAALTA